MFYKKWIRPRLFRHDPEEIHDRVLSAMRRAGKIPFLKSAIKAVCTVHDKRLSQQLFGLTFPNPVGLAAGMDKGGVALPVFGALGLGFLEMGGITALKQSGNDKPRVFRVPLDEGLINRMGFNNPGAEETAYHLESEKPPSVPLGVNIGKSKIVDVNDADEVASDYCYTLRLLHPFADFFVVNVSSPNTQGLRGLQEKGSLRNLLRAIQNQNLKMPRKPREDPKPVLVKIAPDLTFEQIDDVLADIKETGIKGIVATNTTVKNDGFKTTGKVMEEQGGRSGRPLFTRTLEVIKHIHKQWPSLPIIGVGGIFCGDDAHKAILAGASLVQIYTGFVYEGPMTARNINVKLLDHMERDGMKSVSDWRPEVNRN